LPPDLTAAQKKTLRNELKKYPFVVSTIPWKGALLIGDKTNGTCINTSQAKVSQQTFAKQISQWGW
jgi:hypothetical protein